MAMPLSVFLLIIFSGFLHACWNSLAKYVGKNTTILWLSMSLGGWLGFPYLILSNTSFSWSSLLTWGLLCGFSHSIYYVALTHAYSRFQLSSIYPISRGLGIAITSLLSLFYFNDALTPLGGIGVFFVVFGIAIFYINASSILKNYHALKWGGLVGFTIAGYLITDYLALRHLPVSHLVFIIFIVMSILLLPYLLMYRRSELLETLFHKKRVAVLIGLLSFSSYFLLLWVLKISPLGYVVALRETSIIFAGLIAWIFLKEPFSVTKWTAITIISIGAIIIKIS